jgi:RimJ/RimL family protein N-acetyltransferase
MSTDRNFTPELVLETLRLQLRRLRFDDADIEALHAVLGDPMAMRYYPAPLTRSGAENWIQKQLARYEADGYGLWAVVLKSSGQVIGDCGLACQQVKGVDEVE